LAEAPDAVIWRQATEKVAVVVSKDDDFALRAQMGATGPAVVWVRYGNVRRVELLRRFTAAGPSILDALNRGETLMELL
jgi:predicted nuclease of predicted toxin-antitoxin system